MLKNDPAVEDRTYFDDCIMPVDVFHFKSKHKESDTMCNEECNPIKWSHILVTKDGKWRFNSSTAEQTNGWFGKFHPVVREMEATRYDFFLDEMILQHNREVVQSLKQAGHTPYRIPRHSLL